MAMRKKDVWVRRDSLAARWAFRLAFLACLLVVSAGVAHRFSLVETPLFFWAAGGAVGIAAIALMLAVVGFFDLWTNGDRGGRASAVAVILAMLILAPTAGVGWLAFNLPRTADTTTDLRDPPRFSVLAHGSGIGDELESVPLGEAAATRVVGRRYAMPVQTVRELALELVAASGWTVATAGRADFPGGESTMEAVARSFILGLLSDVVIRLTDEGATSYVDMRSVSRYGAHDLGMNARLIERFLAELDRIVAEEALSALPAAEEEEPEEG